MKMAIQHSICFLLFIFSFNNITLNDNKIGLFETEGSEYYIFISLILLAGVVNCSQECQIYLRIFENSNKRKTKFCIIQSIVFHALLTMSWICKDRLNLIFEEIIIRAFIILHFTLLILFSVALACTRILIPKLAESQFKYKEILNNIIDLSEQKFWNECKTWLSICLWRLIIICYGAVNQWWLTMLILIYFTIRPFKNCKMELNMIKAIATALVSLSVFFNSHHHENYYQLKFRDMYVGLSNFNIIFTPFSFVFNHFGHTFILFALHQLTFVMAKPQVEEETDINLIPIHHQVDIQNRDSIPVKFDVEKSKDNEINNDITDNNSNINTQEYILMNFYTTYAIGTLTIAIWIKYLVDSYIRQLTLFDMDIMFIRTIWMIIFQFFNMLYLLLI